MSYRPNIGIYFSSCLFILIALIPIVHAKEKNNVFSCVIWDDLEFKEVYYKKGKEMVLLEFKNGRRSIFYPMDSDGKFELFTKVPALSNDGEEELKLIGKTTYQPGSKRMLFMIVKGGAKSKLPLAIRGIDDSLETFPTGTFRFANFTNTRMKVSFGNVVKNLRPREIEVYKFIMPKNGGLMSMIVSDNKGKPVFGRRLFGQPRDRSLVLITPSPTLKGQLSIKILSEIVVEKTEE